MAKIRSPSGMVGEVRDRRFVVGEPSLLDRRLAIVCFVAPDRLKSSDNAPDAALGRDAALCDRHQAIRTVFHAVISSPSFRDASSTPTEQALTAKHNTDVARLRHTSIISSVADAVAFWQDMDEDINTDSLARCLLPAAGGKLRLGVCLAVTCVLDTYLDYLVESITQTTEHTEYSVFGICAHAAAASHVLLEESLLLALARHPTTLSSRVKDVIMIPARRENYRTI
ncbi:hypothetical protein CGLO_16677 [Colletotrichum gloeosporioides Cg-14]|uniref:Uncharacterized protein n=1 Tax=Colletotrichum gloeosporioides (strain Cg-14) TaxID=1237896 RepID=T0JYK7_COLGC|nr:hypothetical protein CGLO_16677 [Colletotrichum gloeosporioides Cg-14]